MKVHFRFDESNGTHTRATIFCNGANNGQLCLSPDEADWLYLIIERGCHKLGIEFVGSGSHRPDQPLPPVPATPREGMLNLRMQEKLERGEAIDVSHLDRTEDGRYILPKDLFQEGKDYCDARREEWIWSIGRRTSDGTIFASTSTALYDNPDYTCLWLR